MEIGRLEEVKQLSINQHISAIGNVVSTEATEGIDVKAQNMYDIEEGSICHGQ